VKHRGCYQPPERRDVRITSVLMSMSILWNCTEGCWQTGEMFSAVWKKRGIGSKVAQNFNRKRDEDEEWGDEK
jgi:hypothetical protein